MRSIVRLDGDYRDVVKRVLHQDSAMTQADLANSSRVERSYISRVLNGKASFSQDQMYMIAKSLSFKQVERDFCLLSVEMERTQIAEFKLEIEKKIAKVRLQALETRNHVKAKSGELIEEDMREKYYTNALYPLVHTCMAVEGLRHNVVKIAERLKIDVAIVEQVASELQRARLLGDGEAKSPPESWLLRDDRRLSRQHALAFRLKATEYQMTSQDDQDYFFTATMAAHYDARKCIREYFLSFLNEAAKDVQKQPSQDVFHMNFDFFRI